jgi:hypothetical protein
MDNLILAKSINLLDLVGKTVTLKKVDAREYAGPCARCGGTDRLRVNLDRGWFCRHCNPGPDAGGHWSDQIDWVQFIHGCDFKGALVRLVGNSSITTAEIERLAAERHQHEQERAEQEQAVMLEARKNLDWQKYHDNLAEYPRGIVAWLDRGLSTRWMDYYKVGYCPERDSLTIPYFRYTEPMKFECIGLRHRLLGENIEGGRYRPEVAGLGNHLYTPWYEEPIYGTVLLVEGEIKAMVTFSEMWDGEESPLMQVVGIPGKSWKPEWLDELKQAGRLIICLDPDAGRDAKRLSDQVLGSCVVTLPGKIDDLLVSGAMNREMLMQIIEKVC